MTGCIACSAKSEAHYIPSYESFLSHIHTEDRQNVQETIQDAIAGRGSYEIEYRIITGTGDTRVLLAHGEVIVDSPVNRRRIAGTVWT